MKNQLRNAFFILLLSAVTFSCNKDDNNDTLPSTNVITTGTWRVSHFYDNNDDHTSNFTGYTFAFNSDGSLTAISSTDTTIGTYNFVDSQNELHISLGNNDPLNDLSESWVIITKTTTEMKLKDDNTSQNEELHFIKN